MHSDASDTRALADLLCFGSAASEAAVRALMSCLINLSFSRSSLLYQLRRRLAALHHAGNGHFTTPQWKEEAVSRARGGPFGAPFSGWGHQRREVSGLGEEAEGEGCFGSRGCRNMAVLTAGAMHGREGRRMREELVSVVFALNAGRMVAEERCITQLMAGSGNARRISEASRD